MILSKIEWRNQRKSLLIWTVVFSLLSLLFSAIYPQMFTPVLKDSMATLMSEFPESLLATFHISLSGPANLLQPLGFFAYYFQYLFLAACVYAILLGIQSLIQEESAGTIDFLYAQPISREQIVANKWFVQTIILSLFWFVSACASLGGLLLFKEKTDTVAAIVEGISAVYWNEWFVLWFFLTLGMFLSTLIHHANQGTSVALSIVFGLYLLGIVSNLYAPLDFLASLSPIHQGIPATILEQGFPHKGILFLISLLFIALTFFVYHRKDFRH